MIFHMKRILIEGLEINYAQRKVFYKGREIVLGRVPCSFKVTVGTEK